MLLRKTFAILVASLLLCSCSSVEKDNTSSGSEETTAQTTTVETTVTTTTDLTESETETIESKQERKILSVNWVHMTRCYNNMADATIDGMGEYTLDLSALREKDLLYFTSTDIEDFEIYYYETDNSDVLECVGVCQFTGIIEETGGRGYAGSDNSVCKAYYGEITSSDGDYITVSLNSGDEITVIPSLVYGDYYTDDRLAVGNKVAVFIGEQDISQGTLEYSCIKTLSDVTFDISTIANDTIYLINGDEKAVLNAESLVDENGEEVNISNDYKTVEIKFEDIISSQIENERTVYEVAEAVMK